LSENVRPKLKQNWAVTPILGNSKGQIEILSTLKLFCRGNLQLSVGKLQLQINIFINSSKEKKEKEIPLLKEWKVRNKLTTYTIPAHYATQTTLLKSTLLRRHLKE